MANSSTHRSRVLFGILFSSQNFFTISGTALAFWEGSRLYQSGEVANVGKVITVILSVSPSKERKLHLERRTLTCSLRRSGHSRSFFSAFLPATD